MITVNQEIHRAYLQSPVWAEKRKDALAYYGCVCQKCGEYGNDVHHKTYKRTGEQELMRDLMVLCRSCHEAIHAAERSQKMQGIYKPGRKIHGQARFKYLTPKSRDILCEKYDCDEKSLEIKVYINQDSESRKIAKEACKMNGFDHFYESRKFRKFNQDFLKKIKPNYRFPKFDSNWKRKLKKEKRRKKRQERKRLREMFNNIDKNQINLNEFNKNKP